MTEVDSKHWVCTDVVRHELVDDPNLAADYLLSRDWIINATVKLVIYFVGVMLKARSHCTNCTELNSNVVTTVTFVTSAKQDM